MKYDIFISYSRRDSDVAEAICSVLDRYSRYYNFSYFFDNTAIPGGQEYLDRISDAIDSSKVMLFLASKNSYRSKFCIKELLFADKRKINIHQYCIDDAVMPNNVELLLGTHQYRDARSCPIEFVVKEVLLDAIGVDIDIDNTNGGVYSVGDYYNDGIKVGVVFDVWDGGRHGKIVSLDEVQYKWCSEAQYYSKIFVGADSVRDGDENTDKIMLRTDSRKYTAFRWCRSKSKDWYLPAIEELQLLLLDDWVYNSVNATLEKRGATKLLSKGTSECYWSSTECSEFRVWLIHMGRGHTHYGCKHYDYHVRAVATF